MDTLLLLCVSPLEEQNLSSNSQFNSHSIVYNNNNEYVQQMNNEICQSNIWSNITLTDLYSVDKFYFSTRFIKDIHLIGNN